MPPKKTEKTPGKTTKKPTAKKASTAPKAATVEKEYTTTEPVAASGRRLRLPFGLTFKHIIVLVGALTLIGLLYMFRGLFIVAMVNGQPISRITFTQELEKLAGKQVMNSLVTKTLILQEANKQNITVSPQEVDAEIKKIEDNVAQQGQNLEQLLAMQGMTRESLREQVEIQKIIEKMFAKDIAVTDAEVNQYIEENQNSFPEGANSAEVRQSVKDQLRQQKLSEKFQAWLQEAQKNAKINYFVNF